MTGTVLSETRPMARKAHRCSSCGRTITAGETYRRQEVVGDDGLYSWKDCPQCEWLLGYMWSTIPVRDQGYYEDEGLDLGEWLSGHGTREQFALFAARWRLPDGSLCAPGDGFPDEMAGRA